MCAYVCGLSLHKISCFKHETFPFLSHITTKLGFPSCSVVMNPSVNAGDVVRFLGWKDPLGKEMATHFSILAWEISGREEPDVTGCSPWSTKESDMT